MLSYHIVMIMIMMMIMIYAHPCLSQHG